MRSLLTFLLLLLALPALAADLQGRVVGISDGDTFTLLTAGKQQVKIRLAEIDAPESGQPYGNKSKQALSGLVFGKDVRVVVQTTDRYGRTVGRPYVGDLDISAEMVRMGAAWAYREYLRDKRLLTLESGGKGREKRLVGAFRGSEHAPVGMATGWRRESDRELPDKGQHQFEGRAHLSCAREPVVWADQD